MSKNELKIDFSDLERVILDMFEGFLGDITENADETQEKNCQNECGENCSCAGCKCNEIDNSRQPEENMNLSKNDQNLKAEDVDNRHAETLAEQLYNRHYKTWKIKKEAESKNSKEDVMKKVTNEVVVFFKKILSNTLEPTGNLYYELYPGTDRFDYFVTFGGEFDNINNKPYVIISFDKLRAFGDDFKALFVDWNKDVEGKTTDNDVDTDLFGALLGSALGFTDFEVTENDAELMFKFYYFL